MHVFLFRLKFFTLQNTINYSEVKIIDKVTKVKPLTHEAFTVQCSETSVYKQLY